MHDMILKRPIPSGFIIYHVACVFFQKFTKVACVFFQKLVKDEREEAEAALFQEFNASIDFERLLDVLAYAKRIPSHWRQRRAATVFFPNTLTLLIMFSRHRVEE